MEHLEIKAVLENVAAGKLTVADALKAFAAISFEDLGFAKLDHGRHHRTGLPEVIFAPGKTEEQIIKIFGMMHKADSNIIITRVEKTVYNKLRRKYANVQYSEPARMIYRRNSSKPDEGGQVIAVVSAGTADMNVAEEAAVTIEVFGHQALRVYDVGVAGIHRLLAHRGNLRAARAVIVVAGMEGALASVVGGLVAAPVIAVPTSIGYGASFGGLAALLAMLNSCAPGVTVVNIDNGFGAAMAAIKMVRK